MPFAMPVNQKVGGGAPPAGPGNIALHSQQTVDRAAFGPNIPGTVQNGDLGIFIDWTWENRPYVLPSGWTEQVATLTPALVRQIISTRILSASDAGALVTGMSKNDRSVKHLLVFRAGTGIISGVSTPPGSITIAVESPPTEHSIPVAAEPYIALATVAPYTDGGAFSYFNPASDGLTPPALVLYGAVAAWKIFESGAQIVTYLGVPDFGEHLSMSHALELS